MSAWQLTETFRSSSGDVRWGSVGQPGKDPVALLHGTPFSSSETPAGAGHLVQADAPAALTAALIA